MNPDYTEYCKKTWEFIPFVVYALFTFGSSDGVKDGQYMLAVLRLALDGKPYHPSLTSPSA
jgi:hypothetical protein